DSGHCSLHRWRVRVADRLAVYARVPRYDRLARGVDRDRHRRAHRLGFPLRAAGITTLSVNPWQREGSARCSRTPGDCRANGATDDWRRERYQERPLCGRLSRVIAGMICFSAFFGVAIGLGTWLPNIMTEKGFTITKSLTYTFGMTLAVPCASLFMMYALDNFGRKITSVCA